jgi:hypothetical protein
MNLRTHQDAVDSKGGLILMEIESLNLCYWNSLSDNARNSLVRNAT